MSRRTDTFEALGARVPAANTSIWVEHVDGVVRDALHEHAEPLFAGTKLFLGGPALGQIAGDLREPDELAGRVADRVDDDVCPKASSILPHTPPFGLKASFAFCCFQCELGDLLLAILRRVESRKVLSDYVDGLVSLETAGTSIPARDAPLRVEQ